MTQVLIVDEERGFTAQLKERIEALGCTVLWVTTPEDCFQAASTSPTQLILLAEELGARSGLNLCNGLKRDLELQHIPVVVMSRRPASELAEHKALPTRANAYVQKSEDITPILEEVRAMLAREERFARARHGPPPSSFATGPTLVPTGVQDEARSEKIREITAKLPSSRPDPGETLEVTYEQPTDTTPDAQALKAKLVQVEHLRASERASFEARIAELEAEVAFLEGTTLKQAQHIEALESALSELDK